MLLELRASATGFNNTGKSAAMYTIQNSVILESDEKDEVTDIAFSASSGLIYVSGWTSGALTSSETLDAFLMAYNTTGGLVWSRTYGSIEANDYGSSVAEDGVGGAYMVGELGGTPEDPTGATNRSSIFALRYDSAGYLLWERTWGTPAADRATAVAVDYNTNKVYIVGTTGGVIEEGAENAGSSDFFLSSLEGDSGTTLWTRQVGSPVYDDAVSVSVGMFGSIYVVGQMGSDNVLTAQPPYLGMWDPDGNNKYLVHFNKTSTHQAKSMALAQGDEDDIVYMTGSVKVANSADDAGSLFLTQFLGSSGSEQWTVYYKGDISPTPPPAETTAPPSVPDMNNDASGTSPPTSSSAPIAPPRKRRILNSKTKHPEDSKFYTTVESLHSREQHTSKKPINFAEKKMYEYTTGGSPVRASNIRTRHQEDISKLYNTDGSLHTHEHVNSVVQNEDMHVYHNNGISLRSMLFESDITPAPSLSPTTTSSTIEPVSVPPETVPPAPAPSQPISYEGLQVHVMNRRSPQEQDQIFVLGNNKTSTGATLEDISTQFLLSANSTGGWVGYDTIPDSSSATGLYVHDTHVFIGGTLSSEKVAPGQYLFLDIGNVSPLLLPTSAPTFAPTEKPTHKGRYTRAPTVIQSYVPSTAPTEPGNADGTSPPQVISGTQSLWLIVLGPLCVVLSVIVFLRIMQRSGSQSPTPRTGRGGDGRISGTVSAVNSVIRSRIAERDIGRRYEAVPDTHGVELQDRRRDDWGERGEWI